MIDRSRNTRYRRFGGSAFCPLSEALGHGRRRRRFKRSASWPSWSSRPWSSTSISEPDEDVEVVYVMVDNRIVFEENTTVIELDRSEVARIASFNIKVFGDTKMSNAVVVAELVDLFQAYDMVAVQEIKDIDEEVPYLFLDELNGVAGQGNVTDQTLNWSMVLSERKLANRRTTGPRRNSMPTTTGPRCSGRWTMAPCTMTAPTIPSSGEPFMASFMLLDPRDGHRNDLVIVNVHTKPTLAVEEMSALGDVVAWGQANYSNDDDYVILGDFNGDCSYASYNELIELSIAPENYTWLIPDDADTTVGNSRCATIGSSPPAPWTIG